jgi:hypothetical protein
MREKFLRAEQLAKSKMGFLRAQERTVTSRTLKAEAKAAMRRAWQSQAKSGTKLRPDTYLGRNCRRLQSI